MNTTVRLILIALLWPVAIIGLLTWLLWQQSAEPVRRQSMSAGQALIAETMLEQASAAYHGLERNEQSALRRHLARQTSPLRTWLDSLGEPARQVLCIGEYHRDSTRAYIARRLMPAVPAATLMLEATETEVRLLVPGVDTTGTRVPLLEADIGGVILGARQANPGVRIIGIEETRVQRRERSADGSRDSAIAANVHARMPRHGRAVILFGAVHCSNRPGRLFAHMRSELPDSTDLRNVQVLGDRQDGPLNAFVRFLQRLEVASGEFVIPDTSALDPRVREWFALLDQQVFRRFQTVVVFRVTEPAITVKETLNHSSRALRCRNRPLARRRSPAMAIALGKKANAARGDCGAPEGAFRNGSAFP